MKKEISIELIKYCDYFIDLINQLKLIINESDSDMDVVCEQFDNINLDKPKYNIYQIKDKFYNEYVIFLSLISQWINANI
jgi:hypothetical protein